MSTGILLLFLEFVVNTNIWLIERIAIMSFCVIVGEFVYFLYVEIGKTKTVIAMSELKAILWIAFTI